MPSAVWKTLKEISEEYEVGADVLRVNINNGRVPKYHYKKMGHFWVINENYIKQKYSKKIENNK